MIIGQPLNRANSGSFISFHLFFNKIAFAFCLVSLILSFGIYAQSQQSITKEMVERDREAVKRAFEAKNVKYKQYLEKKTNVFIKALHQEYDEVNNQYILWGYVRIRQEPFELEADKVIYNDWTGDIKAEGNVIIRFDKDIFTGSRADFNIETKEGVIYDCRAQVQPSLFMESDWVYKLSPDPKDEEDRYYVNNGIFTACEPNPVYDWSIHSKEAYVHMTQYIQFFHPTFWIWKVPVLYFPYWVQPIKTKRATGFMVPSAGYSRWGGAYIKNRFFLVLSDNADMTFYHDYYSRSGNREGLEARYIFSKDCKGEFRGFHLKEEIARRVRTGITTQIRPPRELWSVDYKHFHLLPYDIKSVVKIDYLNEKRFPTEATGEYSPSELEEIIEGDIESFVNFKKSWFTKTLDLTFINRKSLREPFKTNITYVPQIGFNLGIVKIFSKNFYGTISGYADNVKKGEYVSAQMDNVKIEDYLQRQLYRAQIKGSLWYSLNPFPWLAFEPKFTLSETYWSKRKEIDPDYPYGTWATLPEKPKEKSPSGVLYGTYYEGKGLRVETYNFSATFTGPRFFRIFPTSFANMDAIKHIIEPQISYSYSPQVFTKEIIQMPYLYGESFGLNDITYGINQRFSGRFPLIKETKKEDKEASPAKKGTSITKDIARIEIFQSYSILKDKLREEKMEKGEPIYRYDYPLSNIYLNLDFYPIKSSLSDFTLANKYEYDPYKKRIKRITADLIARFRGFESAIRWSRDLGMYLDKEDLPPGTTLNPSQDDMSTVNLGLKANIKEKIIWESTLNYDYQNHLFTHSGLSLTYNSQCWALTAAGIYQEYLQADGEIIKNYKFDFSFHFKTLGSLGTTNIERFTGY